MSYDEVATGDTPAHIIYIIDASGSMETVMPSANKRRIDVVSDLLVEIAQIMFTRSRKGKAVSKRYKIALYAYGDEVEADTNDEFIPIGEFVEKIPDFGDLKKAQTNTKAAFERALALLQKTLPSMERSPAPMICHLTDGEYTEAYGDPTGVVERIMSLRNPDGNVLVQNIYIGTTPLLKIPVSNVHQWQGIQSEGELSNELRQNYAATLYKMSSKFPATYVNALKNEGYNITSSAPMLFPAENAEMIKLAFVASGASGMDGFERR